MSLKDAEYIANDNLIGPSKIKKDNLFRMTDQIDTLLANKDRQAKKRLDELRFEVEAINANPDNKKSTRLILKEIKTIEERLMKQKKAMKAASDADKLKWFCPNGAQERMINQALTGLRSARTPTLLLTCGNGVGKTTFSVHMMSNIIYGPQNAWFDYDEISNWQNPKLCWYISTADAIAETVNPMIEELWSNQFITDRKYETFKDGKKFISKIVTSTGWTVVFKTFDQDPQKFESAQVGLLILDEPAPEAIWKAVKSRRRRGCLTLLPMTPLYTPPYIVDEIKKGIDIQNREPKKEKKYFWVEASVYEVSKDTITHGGVRGHLESRIIDEMVDSYDTDERDARIYGKLMYFSGMVYSQFSEDLHVIQPGDYPIGDCNFLQVTDPHDSRPFANLWMAVTPIDKYGKHKIIIVAETPNDKRGRELNLDFWDYKKSIPLPEEVASWEKVEKELRLTNVYRIMDKRFGWQKRARRTFAQLLEDMGWYFSPSYDAPTEEGEIMYGHRIVRQQLAVQEDGLPGLLIYSTCRHTIAGFKHYIRRRRIGRTGEDKAEADGQLVEKYKDFMDLLRYGCVGAIFPMKKKQKSNIDILLDKLKKRQYLNSKVGSTYDDL